MNKSLLLILLCLLLLSIAGCFPRSSGSASADHTPPPYAP